MRKIEIVEIENSYLNFFTPAVIVAAGYFLFNLIGWPTLYFRYEIILNVNSEINYIILSAMSLIILNIVLSIIVYYIFIPKLRVKDADYKEVNRNDFFIIFILYFLTNFFLIILINLFNFVDAELTIESDYIINFYVDSKNPVIFIIFILNIITMIVFSELVYRRTIIPLLEDRGLSPFLAAILSGLGSSFIGIPNYIISNYGYGPNYQMDLYHFMLQIFLGFILGFLYVLTRNILFPILLGSINEIFYQICHSGLINENEVLQTIYNLNIAITILISLGIIVYLIRESVVNKKSTKEWVRIIKLPSAPRIERGLLGFFGISLGLLGIQTLVVFIGKTVTNSWPPNFENIFPQYFNFIIVFYIIAFSIPFWLTITTEYAKH
ncbi:MAG: CPBP family glutamic-type intramembrane protease [Candidatus Hodarchaeales archaeon]|jgi:membrane protease YdiL (CAAX protease family)